MRQTRPAVCRPGLSRRDGSASGFVEDYDEERSNGSQEETEKKPHQTTSIFGLRKSRIDQRQSAPADCVLWNLISHVRSPLNGAEFGMNPQAFSAETCRTMAGPGRGGHGANLLRICVEQYPGPALLFSPIEACEAVDAV
jgi:hypothetical protein